jgi:hypothetical protein
MQIETLDFSGFVSLKYPRPLRQAMESAMDSWKAFCTLPPEQKRLLSGGDRINDFGYMKREDSGPRADNKELFHALRSKYDGLLPKAELIGDKRATDFIKAVDVLLVRMGPLIQTFAQEVERRYKLAGFEEQVMRTQDHWTFRYLRYPKGGAVLANPHADRGGFTFHLGESEGGGEYYGFDRKWHPWPVSEEETIIFPSMALQYRSEGALKALWHRVVPTDSSANERFSMVAFVDFKGTHRFDDSRWNMKDFDAGFNYNLPFVDFSQYFIPNKHLAPA